MFFMVFPIKPPNYIGMFANVAECSHIFPMSFPRFRHDRTSPPPLVMSAAGHDQGDLVAAKARTMVGTHDSNAFK